MLENGEANDSWHFTLSETYKLSIELSGLHEIRHFCGFEMRNFCSVYQVFVQIWQESATHVWQV